MSRKDHVYVNFDRKLIELVDNCVSNIFYNGSRKYVDRKDFVTKAVQNQIENEKDNNPKLRKTLVAITREV
jgi:metal-responsive CopG/Arc/MetJ family transcriptional regulator